MAEPDRQKLSQATDAQRIQWFRQYLMDPKQALNQGFNRVVNAAYQKEETGWRWLHKEQLEDVLKSKSMTETLIEAKTFEERPSEYEVLAAKGIKQYHYNESVLKKGTSQTLEAGTSSTAEMTAEQYDKVSEHMTDNFENKHGLKRKANPPKPKEPESPEQINFKKAKLARATALRKCKKQIDQTKINMDNWRAKTHSLLTKGDPAAMQDFYGQKISMVMDKSIEVHAMYMAENGKTEPASVTEHDAVEAATRTIDQETKNLEDTYKQFIKQYSSQISNMVGDDKGNAEGSKD